MSKLRLSNPLTLILGGGLLYTWLTFPFVKSSTLAKTINDTDFNQAFLFSVICFAMLCGGIWFGSRLARRRQPKHGHAKRKRQVAADLRPLIGRSLIFWLIGVLVAIAIIMTLFGGFGSLSSAVAQRNDLVRGKAWIFTLILPLKVGMFGVFLSLLSTAVRSNRMLLAGVCIPMMAITIFFLNVIGGRLFACGLVLQMLIACGQVLNNRGRMLFYTEFFAVLCLAVIIGVFGLSRYATSVSLRHGEDSSEVAKKILRDKDRRDRMLLDNFFDPWHPLTEAVGYLRSERPLYGLYHVTAFSKLVPGLYRYVDRHTSVTQFHVDADLGKRTTPYGVNAYLDFHWAGAGIFFLIGIAQSYSISMLRGIEEKSQGIQQFFANYLIGCVCILSLYLFRSGLTIAISWGFAELLVLIGFYLLCVVRIGSRAARVQPNAVV